MNPFDLIFVLCALLFMWLVSGVYISQKKERPDLVRRFGATSLLLFAPLSIVFLNYLVNGKDTWIMVMFSFILLYMAVEFLLDFVFIIEFRSKPSLHIPYVILFYIALGGFIGISFSIDVTWGYLVSISFWVLLGCLIYLYAGKKQTLSKT
jgi:hypothetical protein